MRSVMPASKRKSATGATTSAATCALLLVTAVADALPELQVQTALASVEITPGRAGRRSLQLPSLEFDLPVAYGCPVGYAPASLSIAVADTRETLTAIELGAANGNATVRLEIPADQLPPLVVADFCTADGPSADTVLVERVVEGFLSAAASLRCDADVNPDAVDETGSEAPPMSQSSYATTPLNVSLICEPPESEDDIE